MAYKKILVAIDLGETSAAVLDKAHALAKGQGAELHVLHAVEPLSITYGGDIPMDFSAIQDEIYEQAKDQLGRFCGDRDIAEGHQHLVVGRPEAEITATAAEINADLIVVGSHARFGLALLLGSTADGVLHHAKCDVLAMRAGDPD